MFKKMLIGTLVLIAITASSAVVYAGPPEDLDIDVKKVNIETKVNELNKGNIETNIVEEEKEQKEEKEQQIDIISPKISPQGEVIADKNLLISINVSGESNVTLSMYKVTKSVKKSDKSKEKKKEETEELILDSVEIQPNDEIEADFVKHIKDIEPGTYKMVFENSSEEELEVIEFKVKNTKEVVNKETTESLPKLLDLDITDLLLGE